MKNTSRFSIRSRAVHCVKARWQSVTMVSRAMAGPLVAIVLAMASSGCSDAKAQNVDAGAQADAAPGEITTTDITVGDLVFHARVAGPETGEVVLLLHGFPEDSYEWLGPLRALAAKGYRAVAPDQRGYSPGARPGVPIDRLHSHKGARRTLLSREPARMQRAA